MTLRKGKHAPLDEARQEQQARQEKQQQARQVADDSGRALLHLADELFPAPSWDVWKACLAAILGAPVTDAQAAIIKECTGRATTPTQMAREIVLICGRRAGKSQIAALLAVYLACFKSYKRARGEKLIGMLLAEDRQQARILKDYIAGLLRGVPELERLILKETAESITLRNGVVISVHTSNYRAVRGFTLIFCISDELAFWPTTDSTESAEDTLDAVRPGLATTGGPLVSISTPYGRTGPLFDAYKKYFGRTDAPVFVWTASSLTMNNTLDEHVIDAAYQRDPEKAAAEYGGKFRHDLSSMFDPEALGACVVDGRRELPPLPGALYKFFCDSSGGSDESMAISAAHRDHTGIAIVDVEREWRSPFDPLKVVAEAAQVMKRYYATTITGDRYTSQWIVSAFAAHGITYQFSERTKSELFLEVVALVNSKQCELLDNPRTLAQFAGLQRRTGASGRDSIDHRRNQQDDRANAVAGALVGAVISVGTKVPFPSTFTVCEHPDGFQNSCVIFGGTKYPNNPHCSKNCPGWKTVKPSYDAYLRAHVASDSEDEPQDIRLFIKEHFAPNDLVGRVLERQFIERMNI